jgi:hypothetical protein
MNNLHFVILLITEMIRCSDRDYWFVLWTFLPLQANVFFLSIPYEDFNLERCLLFELETRKVCKLLTKVEVKLLLTFFMLFRFPSKT